VTDEAVCRALQALYDYTNEVHSLALLAIPLDPAHNEACGPSRDAREAAERAVNYVIAGEPPAPEEEKP
jgi:hypothetical protein